MMQSDVPAPEVGMVVRWNRDAGELGVRVVEVTATVIEVTEEDVRFDNILICRISAWHKWLYNGSIKLVSRPEPAGGRPSSYERLAGEDLV